MRQSSATRRLRLLPLLVCAAIAGTATVVTGCKDSNPVGTGTVDASHTPTMLTRDVETLISDSGVTRYRIITPIWYVYDETPEPYWRFPEGLKLERYDDFFRIEATVTADSATYFKNKQLWRLDGNVTLNNAMKEKFLTNQLFWDQRQEKLYSDSFIHIERPDKVLEGYGFDSDQNLTRYTIRRVSGIFPANSFTPGGKTGNGNQPGQPTATTTDSTASATTPATSPTVSAGTPTVTTTDVKRAQSATKAQSIQSATKLQSVNQ